MAQVLVAAAQIDHLNAFSRLAVGRLFEIFLGRQDVFAGKVRGPVFLAFDDDQHLTGRSDLRF